jgi:hypothetical protein
MQLHGPTEITEHFKNTINHGQIARLCFPNLLSRHKFYFMIQSIMQHY